MNMLFIKNLTLIILLHFMRFLTTISQKKRKNGGKIDSLIMNEK